MVPPNARHFVEHRLVGVTVLNHQLQREIRYDKCIRQGSERKRRQEKLRTGRRIRARHPRGPAFVCANQWNDHLHDGQRQRENECKMSKFYDHVPQYSVSEASRH